MEHLLDVVGGDEITYNSVTDILNFKNNQCTLEALLKAVRSPIDRIFIENTDLLLIKTDLYYKIGCLKLSIEEFKKYHKKIKQL